MYKTHVIFALFVYLLIALLLPLNKEFYALLIVALGSLMPDIDSSSSYINNKLRIGKLAAITSRHRGFWHSIFGMLVILVCFGILFLILNIQVALILYLAFGYLMHLLADSLTVSGIRPFWKYSSFEIKWKIKTNGIFEYILFFVLLILSIYLYAPNFVLNVTSYVTKIFK